MKDELLARWLIIGCAIVVALLGEPLAAGLLMLGFEIGRAHATKETDIDRG